MLVTTGHRDLGAVVGAPPPGRPCLASICAGRPAGLCAAVLDHWRPDLALWVESELWPNLVVETERYGIPLLLLNGRMSARSFAQLAARAGPDRAAARLLRLCLAQDEAQAERFRRLARLPRPVGDLKTAAAPLPFDEADLARIAAAAEGRPLWLAARPMKARRGRGRGAPRADARAPGLLTIIAPRHPVRANEIAAMLTRAD